MKAFNKFNHNTKIVGVIGRPIRHSFSPFMHNLSFELAGLNYIYLPFEVPGDNLKAAIKGMVALGFRGVNVTIPHKEKIIDLLSDASEEAGVIGAVNTVVIDEGKLIGHNTDVYGITETLNTVKNELHESTVSIIGAGGAARSVLYSLIRNYNIEKINLINRTVQRVETLKDYFSAKMHFDNFSFYELLPPDLIEVFQKSDVIINTTPIGLSPETNDSPTTITESFHSGQVVFDLVYNPIQTKLLKIAESRGAKTLDGLKMFVEQGAKAYELWTDEKMDIETVEKALKSQINAKSTED